MDAIITVYPVPVRDNLTVQLKTDKAYTLTVYNLDGKVLLQKKINTTTQVDMSSYAYGV